MLCFNIAAENFVHFGQDLIFVLKCKIKKKAVWCHLMRPG